MTALQQMTAAGMRHVYLLLAALLPAAVGGGGDITISAGGSMNIFAGESISLMCGGGAASLGQRPATTPPALPEAPPPPPPPVIGGRRRLLQQQSEEASARDVGELIAEMRERLTEMEIMLEEERGYQQQYADAADATLLEQMRNSIEEVRQMVLAAETELSKASLSAPAAAEADSALGGEPSALAASADAEARLQLSIEQLVAKERQLKRQPLAEQRPRRRLGAASGGSSVAPEGPSRGSGDGIRRELEQKPAHQRQPQRPPQPQPHKQQQPQPQRQPRPPPPPPPPPPANAGSATEFVATDEWRLISAASDGNQDAVKAALASGASIDRVAPDGIAAGKRTALIAAVSRGRLGAARLLLQHGASLSVGAEATPLLIAASILGGAGIPAGLAKPTRSRDGVSSSTTSAWTSLEMLRLLLDWPTQHQGQFDVGWGNQRTPEGYTALHLLGGAGTAGTGRPSWGPNGLRELRQMLTKLLAGSSAGSGQRALHWDARAAGGRTALMEAASSCQPALVSLFLSLGVSTAAKCRRRVFFFLFLSCPSLQEVERYLWKLMTTALHQ
jgi:hypothetical protein